MLQTLGSGAWALVFISGLLAIAGGIYSFVENFPIEYGCIGVIIGTILVVAESGFLGFNLYYHPMIQMFAYVAVGIIFVIFGSMTLNPVYGLFIAAGVLLFLVALYYFVNIVMGRTVAHERRGFIIGRNRNVV